MLIVGITGGIGSGKSAVTAELEALGIEVIDADIVAREVVEPGKPALVQITEHFGEEIILADGSLDRAELRSKVFASPDERQWLEQLLHPIIREEIIFQLNTATSPYAVLSSPLLLETNQNELVDYVVVVDVPESLQLSRTISRDNNSEAQVKAIMAAQHSREQRLEKSDYILSNDSDLKSLKTAVQQLHSTLMLRAEAHSASKK